MATEEIEISQLELAEDLIGDMVMPVETSTDTKATTLTKFKDWLKGFFISKSGDESFSGTKTMLGSRFVFGATALGKYKEIEAQAENSSVRIGILRFTNGLDGITRSIDISVVDNTNENRGGIKVGVDPNGDTYVTAPTPRVDSNYTNIATTAWHNNKHKVVSALPSNPDSSVFYYIPE